MSVSSVKTRSNVKPKLAAFPASPDSGDPQLEILPAEPSAKPSQGQDLQKSGPGARAGSGLQLDLPVKAWPGRYSKGYSKKSYLHALMFTHQGRDDRCNPSLDTLAKEMGLSRRQAIRIRKQLELHDDVQVVGRERPNCYWIRRYMMVQSILWVDPRYVVKSKLSINKALMLAFIRRRCQGNDDTWFKNQEAAEALGVCRRTAQILLHGFAAEHILQITERPGRGSGGNLYTLTGYGRSIIGVSGSEQKAQKCHPKEKGIEDRVYSHANPTQRGGLSSQLNSGFSPDQDQEVHRLLRSIGIADSVARPMAFEQRYPLPDVKQAIANAALRGDDYHRQMRRLGLPVLRFNLAGYVIRTLPGARREGHGVPPSKLVRAAEARDQGGARAAVAGPPTEAETKKLEQYAENVLKPCLGKPPTPQESAKLAKERRLSDKKAQDALLTKTLETARRNSRSYQKYANLGQNTGICLDKPG